MTNNFTYPAIMEKNINGYDITFPDFNDAMTCANQNEDLIAVCQDFLALTIIDYEESGAALPEPMKNYNVDCENGQSIIYINVWLPYHRSKIKETYVKKTLTIPSWLDILAKNKNINFSAVLTKALKEELDI